MDFETFMPAVPLYEQSRPFQHIPFQFSVHVQATPRSGLKHLEYLGEPETDPRPAFIKQLLAALGDKGGILVYNKAAGDTDTLPTPEKAHRTGHQPDHRPDGTLPAEMVLPPGHEWLLQHQTGTPGLGARTEL